MTATTRDDLRADIAEIIEVAPDAIGDDTNLLDAGLDSMRAMNLAMLWDCLLYTSPSPRDRG